MERIVHNRKIGRVFLAVLVITAACIAGNGNVHAAAKVKLDKSKVYVYVGSKTTLKKKITKKGISTKLVWKSSKPKVISVSSKGRVTAKKVGTAIITVKVKGSSKKSKCTVVAGKHVSKLAVVSAKTVKLKIGAKSVIKTKVAPSNVAIKGVTYRSSDPKIVTVNSKGTMIAKKTGNTTIIVTTNSTAQNKKKKKAKVTVKVSPSTSNTDDIVIPNPNPNSPLVTAIVRGTGDNTQTIYLINKEYQGSMKVVVNNMSYSTIGSTLQGLDFLATGVLILTNSSGTIKVGRKNAGDAWAISDLVNHKTYYLKAGMTDNIYNSAYGLIILKGNTLKDITISS